MDLSARATSVRHLRQLTAEHLELPVAEIGLSTRSLKCIGAEVTVADLLETVEADLMERRNFGRTCLADVRRRLAVFALDAMSAAESDPRRGLLGANDASLAAGLDSPAQPRPLREVLEELLELLSRQAEVGRKSSPARRGRHSGRPQRATLSDIAELLFGCLTVREREVMEVLFEASSVELPSYADVGRRVGLTRERVRQIVASGQGRMKVDEERRRRAWLIQELLTAFEASGGVMSQRQLSEALRKKHPGAAAIANTLSRALLEITSECAWVHETVWCVGVERERVSSAIERLHGLLRRNARIMAMNQLAAALRQRAGFRATSDALIAGCIAADSRFKEFEGRRIGLREWEWGIPRTTEEFVVAALRAAPHPLTAAAVLQAVQSLVPPGREVTQSAIQRVLEGPECIPSPAGTYSVSPPGKFAK